MKFIHFVAEQSKSNIQTADKHLQHFLIKVFNHSDSELENSSKRFLQKEAFSISPAHLALLYSKAKCDDIQDMYIVT